MKIDDVITALTKPKELYSWDGLHKLPEDVLNKSGIYAFYFVDMPPCTLTDKHKIREDEPLYIGMADKRSIYTRMEEHFDGTADKSTLRYSLGVLFENQMGFFLRRKCSDHSKFKFPSNEEDDLSKWISQNARVCFVEYKNPKSIEEYIIKEVSPPLNIDYSKHDFVPTLREMRKEARANAKKNLQHRDPHRPSRPQGETQKPPLHLFTMKTVLRRLRQAIPISLQKAHPIIT